MGVKWPIEAIQKGCSKTKTFDPRQRPDNTFRYIDISGIDRVHKCIASTEIIQGSDAPSRARKVVQEGDVLVSTVRPNLNAVAMVPPELDGQIASTGFCVLRTKPSFLLNNYLFYYVQYNEFVNQLVSQVRGANYPAVSDRVVKEAKIPLPTPTEQRRIVEILDQADSLRKKRAAADKIADRILPALFYKMFGDPASNSKRLREKPLGEAVSLTGGGTPSKTNLAYWNGDISWVSPKDMGEPILSDTADHITKIAVNESSTTVIPMSAIVLVVRSGVLAHSAPLAMLSKPMAINQDMKALVPKTEDLNPWYLLGWGLVAQQVILSCVKRGGTVHSIDMSRLKSKLLILPSPDAQEHFARIIQGHLLQRDSRTVRAEQINSIFNVLLYRAFSGDLTSKWREAHMKELLQEMEIQARELNLKVE